MMRIKRARREEEKATEKQRIGTAQQKRFRTSVLW